MEATYLQPLPLLTMDLIAQWAIALQKRSEQLEESQQWVHASHLTAAICFKKKHFQTIINYMFKRGDLVLMHNTRIEKSSNKKMKLQYLGPLIVVSRNKGGAYILCELDRSVLQNPIAQFHICWEINFLTRRFYWHWGRQVEGDGRTGFWRGWRRFIGFTLWEQARRQLNSCQ